jgi:two-component system, chemotaxis family, chemotaxis protein CheY
MITGEIIMATEAPRQNIYKKKALGLRSDGSAYRAIIVDDSPMTRQILRQILLSVDFTIIEEISNGSLALQILKNQSLRVDYLFVDVEMPVMDGIQLVKEIRPDLPKCKIIMVTSHSDREKVEDIIKLGVDGYIKKPFDRDTVLAKITQIQNLKS